MPKNINFTIKYIIAIIVALLIGAYIAFKVISDAFDRVGLEFSMLLKITYFIGISFAALIIINLLYYHWYLFLSNFSRVARKHGFKRKGLMKNGMLKRINNIEFKVDIFGTLMDRNIIFRIKLGFIVDYKSKNNCVRYDLKEYINQHSKYFNDIYEINKNTTFSFDKVDYFRDVDLIEYFNIIEEIVQMHDQDNNQTEK